MIDPILTVRAFYDALARGDGPSALALLADDLRWTEAEGFPYFSGDWRSPQEVFDNLLAPLARDWDDFSAVPNEFFRADERVVSLGVYGGVSKASGRRLRAPFAHVWTVRDGRIATFDMHTDTLLVRQALS